MRNDIIPRDEGSKIPLNMQHTVGIFYAFLKKLCIITRQYI